MNEKIKNDIKTFQSLINRLDNEHRTQITEMMNEIGAHYFTAPASTSVDKHDCFPGGLISHSIDVYKNLEQLANIWGNPEMWQSYRIVAFMHDLGKACTTDKQDVYILETEDWKIKKGNKYKLNPEIKDGLTHAQRSVRLLSHFGVKLTDGEYLAILSHDSIYLEENCCFRYKMNDLAFLLHWADMKTVFLDKK